MDYEEFKKIIFEDSKEKISLEEFKKLDRYIRLYENAPPEDFRRGYFSNCKEFQEFLYENFVNSPDVLLRPFFENRIKNPGKSPINNHGFLEIKRGKIFTRSDNPRYLREKFWRAMSKSSSYWDRSIREMFCNAAIGDIDSTYTGPTAVKMLVEKNEDSLIALMRTVNTLPSIYSPVTYRTLLKWQQQYMSATPKTLLCPTASWGSPILACRGLDYEKIVLIDVQCDVLDICRREVLPEAYANATLFDSPEPTLETHCVPSENMSPMLNGEKFDHIFFCPPYYDLEKYDAEDENQSTTKYKTYQDWLEGYWRGTVRACVSAMKPDTVFSFTVNDYYNGNYLMNDMLKMAEEFELKTINRIEIDKNQAQDKIKKRSEFCIAMKFGNI